MDVNSDKKTLSGTAMMILAGLVYGIILTGLGVLLVGVGHGPRLYLYLAIAPYGLGFFLWPILGLCLGLMKYQNPFWYVFLIFIICHYLLSGGLIAWNWEWESHWRFKEFWSVLNPFFIIYFAGQIIMWGRFIIVTRKATV